MPSTDMLPQAALDHIPADVLSHLQEIFANLPDHSDLVGSLEVSGAADPVGPADFSLPEAASSHMPPPALSHVPDFFGLSGLDSSWTLPDAALDHMSDTAQAHVPDWFNFGFV